MANAVNWFEIPVTDLERATKFYETVTGNKLTYMEMGPSKMAMFPMLEGEANASGALVKDESYVPSQSGSIVYFSVENIEETLSKVESNGGATIMPKMDIGQHGFVAHFKDCEGNRVALHSNQ